MQPNKRIGIIKLIQNTLVAKALDQAQMSLQQAQFKAFKKGLFQTFHEELKPQLTEFLDDNDQVRAVPKKINSIGKEVPYDG